MNLTNSYLYSKINEKAKKKKKKVAKRVGRFKAIELKRVQMSRFIEPGAFYQFLLTVTQSHNICPLAANTEL